MERLMNIRLQMFKKQLEELVVKSEVALQTGDCEVTLSTALKASIERYVKEIHIYIEKSQNPKEEEVIEHTDLQMRAEELFTRLQMSQNVAHSQQTTTRLPKLELLKYKGEVLRWAEFWDRFCASVHSKNINKVDKFAYLQACLEGEAKESLEGLEMTDINYDIAITTLRERFGRKALVIDAHYSELIKLVRKDNTVRESRRLFNEIERHLRVLHSLGENIDGAHLRTIIMEKFPDDIIKELRICMKTEDENVVEIRKHIGRLIQAREAGALPKDTLQPCFTTETLHVQERRKRHLHEHNRTTEKYSNKTAFMKRKINDNKFLKRPKLACIFCNGSHYNDECNEVSSVISRKKKLGKRCFICFRDNHVAKACKLNRKCAHCGVKTHNRAICPNREKKTPPIPSMAQANTVHGNSQGNTLLQTVIMNICGIPCRALLDTGSERSYIRKDIAKRLNLVIEKDRKLLVYTFGTNKPKEIDNFITEIEFTTKLNKTWKIVVNIVSHITNGVSYPQEYLKSDFSGCILADDGSAGREVHILIGNDYYYKFMHNNITEIEDGLFLIDSDFGVIVSGTIGIKDSCSQEDLSVLTYINSYEIEQIKYTTPDLPLKDDDVKLLWDLEAIGITDPPKSMQEVDEEVLNKFNKTICYEQGRYFVQWPWICHPPNLTNNYGLALGRLNSLLKRLNTEQLNEYDSIFKDQLNKGILEIVTEPTKENCENPVHYLSHHGVTHQGKKLRIVCDASAKLKDCNSLNECLYKGPLMLEDLTRLLINFRQYKIGIIADIEKAFLQVGLKKEDRDVTRLLWIRDLSKDSKDPKNIICYRFCRVPFGVISSPFLLSATINHHLRKNGLQEKVAKKCYVDNLVTSVNNVEDAKQLYRETINAFTEISMNIRDWNSNNKEFLKNIPTDKRGKETDSVNVLGLTWNMNKDTLSLKINNQPLKTGKVTKRCVLRTIASIYDPCGLVSPYILPMKIFLQDLWKLKIKWDSDLSQEQVLQWKEILNNINYIKDVHVHRCITTNLNKSTYQLHCFADASKHSYAAVVYIREDTLDKRATSLIMSKSRLVPVKDMENLQIPKLELLGCLIGSRLLNYVANSLDIKIERMFLWSDSNIVLCWLKSEKLLPPFVNRRISQIKKYKGVHYSYVSSKENPADIATKVNSTHRNEIWLKGPAFLKKKESEWFQYETNTSIDTHAFAVAEGLSQKESNLSYIPEEQIEHTQGQEDKTDEEDNSDNMNSEQLAIKKIQKECFPDEVMGKKTNLGRSLNLFMDEDKILRCKGRMTQTGWDHDAIYPILIPRKNIFTEKIIMETHIQNYHVGVGHTLGLLRKKYWIPKGRAEVKKVLKSCKQCVRHGGGPFQLPETPSLPPERVNYHKAFDYTGVDYFGPVNTKLNGKEEKRWISLFTCLAVRAIHLEMVMDLTAEECLLALKRFVACRGVPILITSDNAAQFRLLANVIMNEYCIKNKIRWRFIPELAPWHGGFYERLIGIVKNCLKKTLEKHLLTDSQLSTTLKEVEAVVNMRPLTYVSTDLEHILTPADFLALGKCLTLEPSDSQLLDGTETKIKLIEGWRRGMTVMKDLGDMFINQYLMSLRERHTSRAPKEPRVVEKRQPVLGETVQIKDSNANRLNWKVGIIQEIIKGKDDQVRSVKVKVGEKLFMRSVGHIYPLEIDAERNKLSQNEESNSERQETNREPSEEDDRERVDKEPRQSQEMECNEMLVEKRHRSAAWAARDKIKEWTKLLTK